ncbi:MAG: heme-binding domain-containing protein [Ignavibacteriae bacterium]|nr:heme-binding protein [Ignavibacteriota bacterium]NOG98398.1 heme-binding domain-containing protein [Ignavibacteriota bacterium]
MKKIIIVLVVLFLIAQFIGPEKTNPPVTADLIADENVKLILKTSCYDCHSNETVYPWYSDVVPVSYLLMNHINEGREHLNFSEWENLDSLKKEKMLDEIWEEVEENEMPMSSYLKLHPEAELSAVQKEVMRNWAAGKNSN